MSHTSAESVTKTEESAEQFFTLWTVFKRSESVVRSANAAADFEALLERLAAAGVTHRGSYDVSAMRADADVMVWLHAGSAAAGHSRHPPQHTLRRHRDCLVRHGRPPRGGVCQEPHTRVLPRR